MKIYARGEEYYREGTLHDLCEEAQGGWWAYVEGTQEYRVYIGLNGDELEKWECDCPYDRDFCKHLVRSFRQNSSSDLGTAFPAIQKGILDVNMMNMLQNF